MTSNNIFLLLLTCLSFACQASLAIAAEFEEPTRWTSADSSENADFQAINSYLTALSPPDSSLVTVLADAIDAIESFGLENFHLLTGGEDTPLRYFAGHKPESLLHIMRELIAASRNCDRLSLELLLLILHKRTSEGQFMNAYARRLMSKCLVANSAEIVQMIERSVGKLNSHLSDMLTAIGLEVSNAKRRQESRGKIVINERVPPSRADETLELLRGIGVDEGQASRLGQLLAKQLSDIMMNRLPDYGQLAQEESEIELKGLFKELLLEPCKELTSRMRPIQALIATYKGYAAIFHTERLGLSAKWQRNGEYLDYNTELDRICKFILRQGRIILASIVGSK